LSWQEITWDDATISTDDLLARTVFYKVGHHASHNATLVAALEKINRPELIAFIPVNGLMVSGLVIPHVSMQDLAPFPRC
jgi:hypothetical protein